jgi:HEAT repeat protein
MKKFKHFYNSLNKKQRISFWIAVAVILISLFRIFIVATTSSGNRNPTLQRYLKQINSRDPQQRADGVFMAGQYRIKDALPALEKILTSDKDEKIRRTAAWSIGKIDLQTLARYLDSQDSEVKSIVTETLLRMDKNNVSYLLERFNKEDEPTKTKIIEYVEASGNTSFNEKLMSIGENTDEAIAIRLKALETLGRTGTLDLEGRLNNLYYNDPAPEISKQAKTTLDAIKAAEKAKEKKP